MSAVVRTLGRSFNWKSRWHTQFQMHLGIKNRCRPKNLREKVVFPCHERIEKLQISGANSLIEFWIFEKCQISLARYAYWGLNNILPGQFYIILQYPINGLIVKSGCSGFKLDEKWGWLHQNQQKLLYFLSNLKLLQLDLTIKPLMGCCKIM